MLMNIIQNEGITLTFMEFYSSQIELDLNSQQKTSGLGRTLTASVQVFENYASMVLHRVEVFIKIRKRS